MFAPDTFFNGILISLSSSICDITLHCLWINALGEIKHVILHEGINEALSSLDTTLKNVIHSPNYATYVHAHRHLLCFNQRGLAGEDPRAWK